MSLKTNKQTNTADPVTIESLCDYFLALNKPEDMYITPSYTTRKHMPRNGP